MSIPWCLICIQELFNLSIIMILRSMHNQLLCMLLTMSTYWLLRARRDKVNVSLANHHNWEAMYFASALKRFPTTNTAATSHYHDTSSFALFGYKFTHCTFFTQYSSSRSSTSKSDNWELVIQDKSSRSSHAWSVTTTAHDFFSSRLPPQNLCIENQGPSSQVLSVQASTWACAAATVNVRRNC